MSTYKVKVWISNTSKVVTISNILTQIGETKKEAYSRYWR